MELIRKLCVVCNKQSNYNCSICCLVFYCSKECQTLDWKLDHKQICKYFKNFYIASVEGSLMGYGMFARRNISAGECIIAEKPFFLLNGKITYSKEAEQDAKEKYEKLNDYQKAKFMALSDRNEVKNGGTKTILGILTTNSILAGDCASICLNITRINHSCEPNSNNTWNSSLNLMTVFAEKDITQNEEIVISYIARDKVRNERQALLKDNFGFVCRCTWCGLEDHLIDKSDKRRKEIQVLDEKINHAISQKNFKISIRLAEKRIKCLQEEHMNVKGNAQITITSHDAYQAAKFLNDSKAMKYWLNKAYTSSVISRGEDYYESQTFKTLLNNLK
jgi:hypothetical protein